MAKIDKLPHTNPEILLERIKTTFPTLSWNSYDYIDEGWDHEVLILDKTYVFRFPNDDEYRAHLKIEIEALKKILPLVTVQVPHYTFIAPDFSFAGYKLVPGIPLTEAYFKELSASDKTLLAQQLAGFLSDIHLLLQNGHDFHDVLLSDLVEAQEETKKEVAEYLPTILDEREFGHVKDIMEEVDALLKKPLPLALIHGDIYHNHLLWDAPRKNLGIIDFGDINRGDPAFDFAELYEYGKDFVEEVYAHYTGLRDETFLTRAFTYGKWAGVYMMTDYFSYHKTSFEVARETFDRFY